MANKDRLRDGKRIEQRGQHKERFIVHVTDAPRRSQRIRMTVTVARVHDDAAHRCMRQPMRKIAPHRNRSQTLVKKNQRRTIVAAGVDALVFESMSAGVDEPHVISNAQMAA